MFMRDKLYGLEDSGSFRIEPDGEVTETKYDSIMRNVVLNLKPKLGIDIFGKYKANEVLKS